jgi:Holliday junction DNA helicase RuvA
MATSVLQLSLRATGFPPPKQDRFDGHALPKAGIILRMISRITGELEAITGDVALINLPGGLTYEIMVTAYTAARLAMSVGQPVTFHTIYYLESQNQGATMHPRLAGFLSLDDRDFFKLFTTCKGLGNRKVLRAMAMATGQIATAVADRDLGTLQSLPEIGRRTAETVIATLSGKVDRFITAAYDVQGSATSGKSKGTSPQPASTSLRAITQEALAGLLQLGENRVQAMQWIEQAIRDPDNRPTTAGELIQAVYRIKAGG